MLFPQQESSFTWFAYPLKPEFISHVKCLDDCAKITVNCASVSTSGCRGSLVFGALEINPPSILLSPAVDAHRRRSWDTESIFCPLLEVLCAHTWVPNSSSLTELRHALLLSCAFLKEGSRTMPCLSLPFE